MSNGAKRSNGKVNKGVNGMEGKAKSFVAEALPVATSCAPEGCVWQARRYDARGAYVVDGYVVTAEPHADSRPIAFVYTSDDSTKTQKEAFACAAAIAGDPDTFNLMPGKWLDLRDRASATRPLPLFLYGLHLYEVDGATGEPIDGMTPFEWFPPCHVRLRQLARRYAATIRPDIDTVKHPYIGISFEDEQDDGRCHASNMHIVPLGSIPAGH